MFICTQFNNNYNNNNERVQQREERYHLDLCRRQDARTLSLRPRLIRLQTKIVIRQRHHRVHKKGSQQGDPLTLRTSDAGIPALRKLPCGVGRRYTDLAQTSLWRRKPVYLRHGCQLQASNAGIPALFSTADWHRHARVIEIQTRQQLKNNCSHETQRIFMNKFCIWTPSGQRTSYV